MKTIIIGGTSHAGKTTLAHAIADNLGWRVLSTDYIARHPGRPWRVDGSEVPKHVIEHFTNLPVDELLADVIRHYRTVWNTACAEINETKGLVVEGSAVLPHLAAALLSKQVCGYWLTLDPEHLRDRIAAESSIGLTDDNRFAIEKFIQRAIAFNDYIFGEAERLNLTVLNAGEPTAALAERILR